MNRVEPDRAADAGRRDAAWEEYRVLQGKLDKIGEFHFLIRGWAVTLIGGLLVTVGPDRNPLEVLAGIPLIGLFHMVESHQNRWQKAFGQRLFFLERVLRVGDDLAQAPRIAGTIVATSQSMRRGTLRDRFLLRMPLYFYLALYAFIALMFAARWMNPKGPGDPLKIEVGPKGPSALRFEFGSSGSPPPVSLGPASVTGGNPVAGTSSASDSCGGHQEGSR